MKELEFSVYSSFCPQCLLGRNYVDIGTAMGQIVRLDKENIACDNQSFEWLVFFSIASWDTSVVSLSWWLVL